MPNFHSFAKRAAVLCMTVVGSIGWNGAANGSDVMETHRTYARALLSYVDAQLSSQRANAEAISTLVAEGHEARHQADMAKVMVRNLEHQKTACIQFLQFLNGLKTTRDRGTASDDAEPESKEWLVLDLSVLTGIALNLPEVQCIPLNDELRSVCTELRAAEQSQIQAELYGTTAECDFLRERLARLEKLANGKSAEAVRLKQQIAILAAEADVIRATPAAMLTTSALRGFHFHGIRVNDVQELVVLIKSEWRAALLKAKADAMADQAELLQKLETRLAEIDRSGLGRPQELEMTTAKLRHLRNSKRDIDETLAAIVADRTDTIRTSLADRGALANDQNSHALKSLLAEQVESAKRVAAETRATNNRAKRVARLAENDEFFAEESRSLKRVVSQQNAELALIRQRVEQTHSLLEALSSEPEYETTDFRRTRSRLSTLQSVMASVKQVNTVPVVTAELDIVANRVHALNQLRSEGLASWSEVAAAESQLRSSRARLAAAEARNAVVRKQQQIVDAVAESAEPTVTQR